MQFLKRLFSKTPRHSWSQSASEVALQCSSRGDPALAALLIIVPLGLRPVCKSSSTCPCLLSSWAVLARFLCGELGAADSWGEGDEVRWRNHVDSLRRGSFHLSEFHLSPTFIFHFKRWHNMLSAQGAKMHHRFPLLLLESDAPLIQGSKVRSESSSENWWTLLTWLTCEELDLSPFFLQQT